MQDQWSCSNTFAAVSSFGIGWLYQDVLFHDQHNSATDQYSFLCCLDSHLASQEGRPCLETYPVAHSLILPDPTVPEEEEKKRPKRKKNKNGKKRSVRISVEL